jgi:hypothetical protein
MALREVLKDVQSAERELATTKGSSVWVAANVAPQVHATSEWVALPAGVRGGVQAVAFLRRTRMVRKLRLW